MNKKLLFSFMAVVQFGAAYADGAPPAHDVYVDIGLPGLVGLGYAKPFSASWGLRTEYSGGINVSQDGTTNGMAYSSSVKASQLGGFVDWFPFDNGFRLVAGITANDIKAGLVGNGSGTATINGKTVNMANEKFNVDIKFPSTSPYLGIGYGHQKSNKPGLGFHADFGLMFGTFTADVSTSLVNKTFYGQTISQADIDKQTQDMRKSLASVNYLPRISMGLIYRF